MYLVGAGPGDPGLLTLKAARLLEVADVVVYDNLVSDAILDRLPPRAERVYAGKEAGSHTMDQPTINALLAERAQNGQMIVRLKGGDPFVFGRGGEEAEYLAARDIRFEIVPGVTSAIGVPAYAGIPVTHRGRHRHWPGRPDWRSSRHPLGSRRWRRHDRGPHGRGEPRSSRPHPDRQWPRARDSSRRHSVGYDGAAKGCDRHAHDDRCQDGGSGVATSRDPRRRQGGFTHCPNALGGESPIVRTSRPHPGLVSRCADRATRAPRR